MEQKILLKRYFKNGKLGFANDRDEVVIAPIYDFMGIDNSFCIYYIDNARYDIQGNADKNGDRIAPVGFTSGLCPVAIDGQWGFIDLTGQAIIPLRYEEVNVFTEGLANVKINGRWGYIDKTGREVIPFRYENASVFNDGLAIVKINDLWETIDKTGATVAFSKTKRVCFTDGLACIEINCKYGCINASGKEILPVEYDGICMLTDGIFAVLFKDKWTLVDANENLLVNHTGENGNPLVDCFENYDEMVPVRLNGKYGFISRIEQKTIEMKFAHVSMVPHY
jgi:hypothetical protein